MSYWSNFGTRFKENPLLFAADPFGITNSLFKPGPNPADAAMPYFEQAKEQYAPYQQQGQEAYGIRNPINRQMAQDPVEFLNQLQSGYQESPGFQQRRDSALNAAYNSAAAGGMAGSPQDTEHQFKIANSLMGEDMQQWLQNAMGIQGMGMQGLGDTYNKGYGATSDIGNIIGTQGSLAFQGQANKNKSQSDMVSAIMAALGAVGGGIAGGPGGAMLGSQAGSRLGQQFM